jgi:hypothetical protein
MHLGAKAATNLFLELFSNGEVQLLRQSRHPPLHSQWRAIMAGMLAGDRESPDFYRLKQG